jgi:Flp pilus assembly protein CpaB
MRRFTTVLLLVVALGGGFAAAQALASLPRIANGQPEANQTVTVLVAIDDISAGTPIMTPEMCFEERQVPLTSASKKAFHRLVDMKGQKLEKRLAEGDFASLDTVTPPLAWTYAAYFRDLHPDLLACTVLIECESICGGFYRPFSRVDLILTVEKEDQESESKVIMRNLFVMAVDQEGAKPGREAKVSTNMTLAVRRGQDEQLKAAAFQGRLTPRLRRISEDGED